MDTERNRPLLRTGNTWMSEDKQLSYVAEFSENRRLEKYSFTKKTVALVC